MAQISSVIPTIGPARTAFTITITGRNFDNRHQCAFESCDHTTEDSALISASSLVCRTPKSCAASGSRVGLLLDGGDFVYSDSVHVTFRDVAMVYELFPTLGSTGGGTEVRLIGSSFMVSIYSCVFDRREVPAKVMSSSILMCITPPAAVSVVRVKISNTGAMGEGTSDPTFEYQYIEPMTCSEVSSLVLAFKQLNTITVTGTNFVGSPMLSCATMKGGERWLHPARLVSQGEIECQIMHQEDAVNVGYTSLSLSVSNNAVDFADCKQSLQLIRETSLSVEPSLGPIAGGTNLLVSIIEPALDVHFVACIVCGKVASATILSKTSISCVSPAADEKAQCTVQLHLQDGTRIEVPNKFKYHERNMIHSMSPSHGPTGGNTEVEIFGSDFVLLLPSARLGVRWGVGSFRC